MGANTAQVERLAARMGATIEISEDTCDIYAYTPIGYVWKATGASTLVEPYASPVTGQSWQPRACAVLIERMTHGLEAVTDVFGAWWDDEGETLSDQPEAQ